MINTSIEFVPPIQLSTLEKANPLSAMADFFREYPLQETKSRIWQWYVDSVQNPEVNAGDLVLFAKNLIKLVDVAHCLSDEALHSSFTPSLMAAKMQTADQLIYR